MENFKEIFGVTPERIFLNLGQTLYMVGVALLIGTIIAIPLSFILVITRPNGFAEKKGVYWILSQIINIIRSIPFVILLIFIMPLTNLIVGTRIGSTAAIVPLTIYIIPYMARVIEGPILEVNPGITETARSMGATTFQTIRYFLFPEAFPTIILSLTTCAIALINASAMAGTIGGGGIGNLAMVYGYQSMNTPLMIIAVIILVVLVQGIQTLGNFLFSKIKHHS